MAAAFLKWAGGKKRLAPLVVERAPRSARRYHEPFVGAGAVYFALEAAGLAGGAVLNDANQDLIDCFRTVRDDLDALVEQLKELSEGYLPLTAEGRAGFYYARRGERPEERVERAAWLIFLNRTCYNGLYRVNGRGGFNVPHGRYLRPRILDEGGLRVSSLALQGVDLRSGDFEDICAGAMPGDFVYLDPPYQPLTRTARFTHYTKGDFGPGDQERLRDAFEEMTRRGVAAMLSNSEHEAIRELYEERGYRIEQVEMSRAINSVGSGRAPIAELLISNFERPEVRAALEASPK
jgi:DNA adenine methylase